MRLSRQFHRGNALLMTIGFILLLGLEAAMVSLIMQRTMTSESLLRGENILARHAAEATMEQLKDAIYQDLRNGMDQVSLYNRYKRVGGSVTTYSTLTDRLVIEPNTGITETQRITSAAWIDEYRGQYYRLVGRAVATNADLMVNKWVLISPCIYNQGVLSTILPASEAPKAAGTYVDSTGRAYLSISSKMLSWKNNVLSTLIPDRAHLGFIQTGPDGWLYFNAFTAVGYFFGDTATGGRIMAWRDGVLSTLTTVNVDMIGYFSSAIGPDGRLFFGQGTASTGNFWTWKNGVLSTLLPSTVDQPGYKSTLVTGKGRLFFGSGNPNGHLYTWKDNVLSTITPTTLNLPGQRAIDYDETTERLFFGSSEASGSYYTWKNNILSTLISGLNQPGTVATRAVPGGRVFFGGAEPAQLYTWAGGVLSTLTSQASTFTMRGTIPAGTNSNLRPLLARASDGRIFAASSSSPFLAGNVFTWKDGVLSTLLPALVSHPASESTAISPVDNRIIMGMWNGGSGSQFWTWKDNVLSTLATGLPELANGVGVGPDGRFYVGHSTLSSGSEFYAWTWKNGVLSTLLPAGGSATPTKGFITDPVNGRVFFNNDTTFWTWSPPPDCNAKGF